MIPKTAETPFWESKAIYVVRSGSHAYGTNLPASDEDTRGVCIPPSGYLIGLQNFEQHEDKSIDRVIYGLHKFVRLALQCNPNIIELLNVRSDDILHITEAGQRLRDKRHIFLSKRAFKTFGGYAIAQLKMLQKGKTAKHGSHVGLVERFGYDCKNAMHLIRLLRMGVEILQTGEIYTYRPDAHELLEIRRGEWALELVLREADRWDKALVKAHAESGLPEEPDFEAANHLVMDLTRKALEGDP